MECRAYAAIVSAAILHFQATTAGVVDVKSDVEVSSIYP